MKRVLIATILLLTTYASSALPNAVSTRAAVQITPTGCAVIFTAASGETILSCPAVPATSTATATATPTDTVQPPTATITPTDTSAPPTATALPPTLTSVPPTATSGAPIQPFAAAPACASDDLTTWHGLWNYTLGCHYTYEQGDDPHLGDSIFGPPAAAWGGQTISWPWVSSAIENVAQPRGKHNGYKWSVKVPGHNPWPPCGVFQNQDQDPGSTSNNCIRASRIEVHLLGSLEDSAARYHSSYVEYEICSRPSGYTQCGIFRMGSGLTDFAELAAPHYGTRIVRPGGPIDFGGGIVLTYTADTPDLPALSGEPYVFDIPSNQPFGGNPDPAAFFRAHPPTYNALGFNSSPRTMAQWATNDLDCEPIPPGDPCHQLFYRFLWQISNTWTLANPLAINTPVFICRDGSCGYNGSAHGAEEVAANVLQSWDPSGAGFVTFHGFTDRWGNPMPICAAPSFSCVPMDLVHVPVGYAAHRSDTGCECDHELPYDLFFNAAGQQVSAGASGSRQSGWIQFTN